ncbi:MAG: 1-deoxy-D-xylulose-5-phosphate synthase [Firmicutes bacterium]|nr:1-deoxy-D-xylulose-5-phosphate synthase [Bacillota bacterium]
MKKLTEYDFPADLKTMSEEDLELLAVQIREFLIDKVSKTGGHLASNLGVVELTIALHKVFDSPRDKIVWDVGHQAYVHKILTGRAKDFDTLRQFGGMSGFPKVRESEHDMFDTGHSTTSLSMAMGLACARDMKGEDGNVIAVIGDGSMTGGMAYEALNNIGFQRTKMIIILNDNGMSISKNVGGVSKYLSSLRTSQGYLNVKQFVKDKTGDSNIGRSIAHGLSNIKNDLKISVLDTPGVMFENMGITYLGPIDGHDIESVVASLEQAKSLTKPVVIHCLTQKGKGYLNAEKDPGKFHGLGPFDPETGELKKKSSNPSYSSVMGDHLLDMAKRDDRVVAITAAMGDANNLISFGQEFPKRYYDVGIAEEHAVTFAAGLAKGGLKPFVCVYSTFLQRAYDQMLEDVCLQGLDVVFLMDRAGVVGQDGETHHGIFDLSYLNTMPKMTVLCPKNGRELKLMMDWALEHEGPCAIRYPRGECVDNNAIMSNSDELEATIRISEGKDVDIWSVGKMYDTAAKVRDILEEKGVSCGLVDVKCEKPLDVTPYFDCSCGIVVSIEDNILNGGFGDSLRSALSDAPVRTMSFGWPDSFIEHGSYDDLFAKYGLTAGQITDRILEEIGSPGEK